MHRDMDLVRDILVALDGASGSLDASDLSAEDRPRDVVAWHFRIMDEAGLIRASFLAADNNPYYVARAERLTWEGCEFLETVRDPAAWRRVKQAAAQAGAGALFAAIKAAASELAASAAQRVAALLG